MDYDFINGEKVPQTIINEDFELAGTHSGTVRVEGGHFSLRGTLQGTLTINSREVAEIHGVQQGTVGVLPNSIVRVTGKIQGTISVSESAKLIVEETGQLQGTLSNNGIVILRGVLAGVQSGCGEIILEGKGYIKAPIVKNGVNYYYNT